MYRHSRRARQIDVFLAQEAARVRRDQARREAASREQATEQIAQAA